MEHCRKNQIWTGKKCERCWYPYIPNDEQTKCIPKKESHYCDLLKDHLYELLNILEEIEQGVPNEKLISINLRKTTLEKAINELREKCDDKVFHHVKIILRTVDKKLLIDRVNRLEMPFDNEFLRDKLSKIRQYVQGEQESDLDEHLKESLKKIRVFVGF